MGSLYRRAKQSVSGLNVLFGKTNSSEDAIDWSRRFSDKEVFIAEPAKVETLERDADPDPDFLAALPEDIRREVLEDHRRQRLKPRSPIPRTGESAIEHKGVFGNEKHLRETHHNENGDQGVFSQPTASPARFTARSGDGWSDKSPVSALGDSPNHNSFRGQPTAISGLLTAGDGNGWSDESLVSALGDSPNHNSFRGQPTAIPGFLTAGGGDGWSDKSPVSALGDSPNHNSFRGQPTAIPGLLTAGGGDRWSGESPVSALGGSPNHNPFRSQPTAIPGLLTAGGEDGWSDENPVSALGGSPNRNPFRHQLPPAPQSRMKSAEQYEQDQRDTNHIVIAVCGVTGTGKSTFISKASGKEVAIGYGLQSGELVPGIEKEKIRLPTST